MIMKNVHNFQIAKVQLQGAAQHYLLDFFANASLVLLIKVLLIKKTCNYFNFYLKVMSERYLQFEKNRNMCVRNFFCPPVANNWIQLLQNYF